MGFPNFVVDCLMTALYNAISIFFSLSRTFLKTEFLMLTEMLINRKISKPPVMLLCLEEFWEELGNFSELAVNVHNFKV